jgi:hypothetical protein
VAVTKQDVSMRTIAINIEIASTSMTDKEHPFLFLPKPDHRFHVAYALGGIS